jgi:hypothetical protein
MSEAPGRRANQWDKIPKRGKKRGETAREFEAFTAYLLLGTKRSLLRSLPPERSKSSSALRRIKQLSSNWKWVTRAEAWDWHQWSEQLAAYESRFRKLEQRRAEADFKAQDMLEANRDAIAERLAAVLKMPSTDVELENTKTGVIQRAKGIRPADIAFLVRALLETITKTVTGVKPAVAEATKNSTRTAIAGRFGFVEVKTKQTRTRRAKEVSPANK